MTTTMRIGQLGYDDAEDRTTRIRQQMTRIQGQRQQQHRQQGYDNDEDMTKNNKNKDRRWHL